VTEVRQEQRTRKCLLRPRWCRRRIRESSGQPVRRSIGSRKCPIPRWCLRLQTLRVPHHRSPPGSSDPRNSLHRHGAQALTKTARVTEMRQREDARSAVHLSWSHTCPNVKFRKSHKPVTEEVGSSFQTEIVPETIQKLYRCRYHHGCQGR